MIGLGGDFANWQFGQVFGTLGLLIAIRLVRRLLRKPKGERAFTKTFNVLVIVAIFTTAMGVVYAVSSAPLYRASSRVNEGIDLVIDVSGHEVVDTFRYPRVMRVFARRPDPWPRSCIPGELTGLANVEFAEPLDDDDFLAIAAILEQDGYTTDYNPNAGTRDSRSLRADRADRSYAINEAGSNTILVIADGWC